MKEESFGVCIYKIEDYTTKILMVKARGLKDWGFIKGKPENNEKTWDCAIRECKEETNIDIWDRDLEEFWYSEYKRKNIGIFLVDAYNIDLENQKIILAERELEDIKWFDVKDDIISITQPNQRQLIKKVINHFIYRKHTYK